MSTDYAAKEEVTMELVAKDEIGQGQREVEQREVEFASV